MSTAGNTKMDPVCSRGVRSKAWGQDLSLATYRWGSELDAERATPRMPGLPTPTPNTSPARPRRHPLSRRHASAAQPVV
ncbi:hypothetical protein O3P69_000171 [Scylla paramamosain]|uniref:Uncharacterized protein n=1 Tax=Scylla paramamosain TaxID=85552 RepID=A0AAW0UY19_SCYPA